MSPAQPKNLVLILARQFASKLATAALVCDAEGRLVYFNEPAEAILGRTFAEAGEMRAQDWPSLFQVVDSEGRPVSLEGIPAGAAYLRREPAQGVVRMVGLDHERRTVSVTALPLFAHPEDFVGMIAVFWQLDGEGAAAG